MAMQTGASPLPVLRYWAGYRYVVAEEITVPTLVRGWAAQTTHCRLFADGRLVIGRGYPWDGNSGPLPEWDSTRLASLVHDVLCDMINAGLLPMELQPLADQEYYRVAVARGLWWRVARAVMLAIRWYMTGKADRRATRPILEA
jgi:hypothetical protein